MHSLYFRLLVLMIANSKLLIIINFVRLLALSSLVVNFDISDNEARVISCALQAVQLINSGGLSFVSSDVKKRCSNYLFTVNKLVSVLGL